MRRPVPVSPMLGLILNVVPDLVSVGLRSTLSVYTRSPDNAALLFHSAPYSPEENSTSKPHNSKAWTDRIWLRFIVFIYPRNCHSRIPSRSRNYTRPCAR